MPLFECERCGVVDNTALTNFWLAFVDESKPRLCSQCDPEIGKWHERFPRTSRADLDAASDRKVEYPAREVRRG